MTMTRTNMIAALVADDLRDRGYGKPFARFGDVIVPEGEEPEDHYWIGAKWWDDEANEGGTDEFHYRVYATVPVSICVYRGTERECTVLFEKESVGALALIQRTMSRSTSVMGVEHGATFNMPWHYESRMAWEYHADVDDFSLMMNPGYDKIVAECDYDDWLGSWNDAMPCYPWERPPGVIECGIDLEAAKRKVARLKERMKPNPTVPIAKERARTAAHG